MNSLGLSSLMIFTLIGTLVHIYIGVCVDQFSKKGTCETGSHCVDHLTYSAMLDWNCGNVSSDIIPPEGSARTKKKIYWEEAVDVLIR